MNYQSKYTGLQIDEAVEKVIDKETYLPLSGGTMTGALELAADPTTNMQASTKQYVDNEIADIKTTIDSLSTEITNLKAGIVTVHSGTAAAMTPDVGSDGDVYLVTE